jgi:hypothetical protein
MSGIYGIPETFENTPSQEDPTSPVPTRHPRPTRATVQRRDEEVLQVVREAGPAGISRVAVAEMMTLTLHEAYLALNRLQHRGVVKNTRRNNAHVWVYQRSLPEGK